MLFLLLGYSLQYYIIDFAFRDMIFFLKLLLQFWIKLLKHLEPWRLVPLQMDTDRKGPFEKSIHLSTFPSLTYQSDGDNTCLGKKNNQRITGLSIKIASFFNACLLGR